MSAYEALEPYHFSRRMEEARDVAATREPPGRAAGVTWKIPPAVVWRSVEEAAVELRVSGQRVRFLCSDGRIPGARRTGRPWKIPARRGAGGVYRIEVLEGSRGPEAGFETVPYELERADLVPF
jgi:hypothetical protein